MRESGIEVVGDVPTGTHFCHFYKSKEDLLDILLPYFRAGLESNEFCMWVTSQPLGVEEARAALARAVPNFNSYLTMGQIEILDYSEWYTKSGQFVAETVLENWAAKAGLARERGFSGTRVSGNTFWLDKKDWRDFAEYEAMINGCLKQHDMIALCSYSLDNCAAPEFIDVIRNHEFALVRRDKKWDLIESLEARETRQAARRSEEQFRAIFEGAAIGVALVGMDGKLVKANPALQGMLGYTREELTSMSFAGFTHPDDIRKDTRVYRQMAAGKRDYYQTEKRLLRKGGSLFWGNLTVSLVRDSAGEPQLAIAMVENIDGRKRAEEIASRHSALLLGINRILREALAAETEEHLGQVCLAVAEELTQSRLGFIGEIGAGGKFHDIAISDAGWERYDMYDKTGRQPPPRNLSSAGIHWAVLSSGRSLLTNDPSSHAASIGITDGHPPMTSFLGAPLLQDGKTIGMIGLANKEAGYTKEDMETLEAVSSAVVEALMRRRAEEALRRSEERLQRSQEIAHLGSWELDLARNELIWSDEVYRLFGLQPGQFGATYEAFLEAVHPDDREAVDAAYSTSISEGRDSYEIEHRIVRRSTGEIRYVHERCEHLRDSSGNILRSAGMVQDITDRKRAEESLRESEEKFRTIVETANEGVWAVDAERRTTYLNQKMAEILGTATEEVLGGTGFRFLDEQGRAAADERFERMRQGVGDTREMKLTRADGSHVWALVNSNPLLDAEGRFSGTLSMVTDITQRKRAEDALRESEEKFRLLVENSREIIWRMRVRPVFRFEYVSPAALPISGYSIEEWLSDPLTMRKFVHPEDHSTLDTLLESPQQISSPILLRSIRKGGFLFWTETSFKVTSEKGEPAIIEGVTRDVTRRIQAQQEVDQVRQEFMGVIGHELKTPLTVVMMAASRGLRKWENLYRNEFRDLFQVIEEHAERLNELVGNLLDVTRIDAGSLSVSPEPIDLLPVMKEAVTVFSRSGGHQEVVLECPSAPPRVKADARRITQVLSNLLSNAGKFSPPDQPIIVAVEAGSEVVTVHVRDRGVGIQEHQLPLLFVKFSQLHRASGQRGGTGLGLVICKGIIEAHGGRIWASSFGDSPGATFSFTLPRA